MPKMFPMLMPSIMPKVMPDMIAAVGRRIDMPDYMREQMPDLLPQTMESLMPNMLPLLMPYVVPSMIRYLKGEEGKAPRGRSERPDELETAEGRFHRPLRRVGALTVSGGGFREVGKNLTTGP